MTKIIQLSLVACALITSSNAFGMLRLLTTAHTLKTQRPYHAARPSFLKLPPTNVFNSLTDKHDHGPLMDLFDRNDYLIDLLKKQNDMVLSHTFYVKPLDRALLVALEQKVNDCLKIRNETNE